MRRQHAGGVHARGRQCQRAQAGAPFGTRTETKNVNSIRFIEQVVAHEARRQVDVLEAGGQIVQETRAFDPDQGTTRPLRSKEDAHDYRYFPEPDLLPVTFDDAFVEACRASLPELPDAKRARYRDALGLPAYNAAVLTADVETARYFDAVVDAVGAAHAVAASNWIITELLGLLNRTGTAITDSPVAPARAAELLRLVADGTVSNSMAKQVFEAMVETGDAPATIVAARGQAQVSDAAAIDAAIGQVLAANPDKWRTTARARTSCSASSSARR